MIIENAKIPFLDYSQIKEGEVGVIKSDFEVGGKFNKPMANVLLSSGQLVKVSFNDTSIGFIVSVYGQDTSKWLGKKIQYGTIDLSVRKGVRVWRPIN